MSEHGFDGLPSTRERRAGVSTRRMASLAAAIAALVGAAIPYALSAGGKGDSPKSTRLLAASPLADDAFSARFAGMEAKAPSTKVAVARKADRAKSGAGAAGIAFALLPPIAPMPLARPAVVGTDGVATASIPPSPERLAYAETPADDVPLPQRRPRNGGASSAPAKAEPMVAALESKVEPKDGAARNALARTEPKPAIAEKITAAIAPKPEIKAPAEKPAKPLKARTEFTLASLGGGKPKRAKPPLLGYAPVETATGGGLANSVEGFFNRPASVSASAKRVAIYDISAAKVYLPNGQVLEAHSGLGHMKDNPRYIAHKMNGPTPPDVYKLQMREKRFHGVAAIRMLPVDGRSKHGRTGFLAHTALVRGTNGSHGCVAFKDYQTFLKAFKSGKITHMVVVNRKSDAPKYLASL